MKTFVSIQSGRNANEVYMYFRDMRDADFVVHELRIRGNYQLDPPRVTLNVLCIAAEQYCHASRDNNHAVMPIELGRTFATGFDGQLLIQAQIEPNVSNNGSPSSRLGSWVYTKVRQFVHSFSDIKVMQPVSGMLIDQSMLTSPLTQHQNRHRQQVTDHVPHRALRTYQSR